MIRKAFDKCLLFLACRHCILEIVASAVFDKFFRSSGSQIAISVVSKRGGLLLLIKKRIHLLNTSGCIFSTDKKHKQVVEFLHGQLSHEIQPHQDFT